MTPFPSIVNYFFVAPCSKGLPLSESCLSNLQRWANGSVGKGGGAEWEAMDLGFVLLKNNSGPWDKYLCKGIAVTMSHHNNLFK